MVSEMGGQLNSVLHSSTTVCDLINAENLPKTAVN